MNKIFKELFYKFAADESIILLFFNNDREYSIIFEQGSLYKISNNNINLKKYSKVDKLRKGMYEILYLSTDYDCLYAILKEEIVIQLSPLADGNSLQQVYIYSKADNKNTPLGITEYEASKKRALYYEPFDLDKLDRTDI
ncbi:MAG: hypothetical protein LBE92_07310 [Chryseobacterium sp.]|jgi:hypothetical protein|uniref:hypothetical protein n=1 Tax=Chryseobacterium sp. TaxID=1871047 RepID=UPI00282AC13A|nr:hypothetical protein [Chryseobacterium sp.]MDR2235915.1 hypothetical protein [Chryseobacterium sp.]